MQTTLLNTTQAARYMGLSKAFLERDRWAGAKCLSSRLAPARCATGCKTWNATLSPAYANPPAIRA
ncbi:hypothetical protein [Nitrosospira sp. NRS527]|uniref:hypothetical protein n=1 Tax=Nitrosospira sp. NRS527 TaxID=155925 RepID=UPI001AF2DD0E|nr:hypothetical protein [Nitrosospira sp. NRS527]BCT68303.1 hypothetical protein NNRS527_01899 [Nitrosospira sp. NRS527]